MKRRDLLKYSGVAVSGAVFAKYASQDPTKLDGFLSGGSTAPELSALTTVTGTAQADILPNIFVPVIPQYDLLGKPARAVAIAGQRLNYIWTENTPFAQGIPYAAGMPVQELPSIEWLIKAATIIVEIVANFLASIPGGISALWQNQADRLNADFAYAKAEYARITAPGVNQLDPVVIASAAKVQTLLLAVLTNSKLLYESIKPQINTLMASQDSNRSERFYKSLFATIALPDIANTFHQDDVFAHLRVAGQNPMLIKGVSSLPTKFPLTNAQYQQVMGDDDLATAAAENRLYLLDYVDLGLLATSKAVAKPLTGVGYSYAPIALFAIPKGGSALKSVAIQCDQDPAKNPIFLPPANPNDTSAKWSWEMAKTVVQGAEENYHEIFVHLARTHLVSEAFTVATQRNFAPTHPLNVLLTPHFEGSHFINLGAALLLLPPAGFIDVIFAAPIEDIQATTGVARLGFDFYAHMLPADLAARKVDRADHLPVYPYRDDALLVWNAIAQWTRDYVGVYYKSDRDVTGDYELVSWVNDVASNGKIKGFKAITTREQLADVLTMIIFTASAQHAAVNFSQPSLTAYAPAISALHSAPAPTDALGKSENEWSKMLPPAISALERLVIYNILGGVYHGQLGQYRSTKFPYLPVITDSKVAGNNGPLDRFQTALKGVEAQIKARNLSRARPYEFLLPSKIPASVNI